MEGDRVIAGKPTVYKVGKNGIEEDREARDVKIYVGADGKAYKEKDAYGNSGGVVTKVIYSRRRWWEFWKKRSVIGYEVSWE